MLDCYWKQTFGMDCFTCGFQRSFSLLLKGELWESIQMFPATIPLLLTALLTLIHVFKRLKHGPNVIVGLFSLSAVLILVNYTVKHLILTH